MGSECEVVQPTSGIGAALNGVSSLQTSDSLTIEVFVEEDLAAALTAADPATAPRIEFLSSAEGAMPQPLDPEDRDEDSSEHMLRFRVRSDGTDVAQSGWTVTLIDPINGDTLARCRLAPE